MKTKYLKCLTTLSISAILLFSTVICANAKTMNGWMTDKSGNWHYYDNDGELVGNATVDGYVLDSNGDLVDSSINLTKTNAKYEEFANKFQELKRKDQETFNNCKTTYDYINYSNTITPLYTDFMNEVYNYDCGVIPFGTLELFKTCQYNWVSNMEQEAKNQENLCAGGSITSYIGGITRINLMRARIYQLIEYCR